jgi:hypothetical protein
MSHKPQPPDYDKREQELWRSNAKDVKKRLADNNSDLLKRIKTFIWRFGYYENVVTDKIMEDKMFADTFAKEPRRQGIHENIAAEYLKNFPEIENLQVLPKAGPKSIYITSDGQLSKTKPNNSGKSLDFTWTVGKDLVCYAAHKYTKEVGGNQDSQYKELIQLLKNFSTSNEKNTALFVICDGPYYTKNKMDLLINNTRTHKPYSFAVHIEDVVEKIHFMTGSK